MRGAQAADAGSQHLLFCRPPISPQKCKRPDVTISPDISRRLCVVSSFISPTSSGSRAKNY